MPPDPIPVSRTAAAREGADAEPGTRHRPIRRRRWYLVLLIFFWLLALPLLVLFYAMLVEGALATPRGRAMVLGFLILIPLVLLHESWRWATGHLDERKHRDRRAPRDDRRHDDPPAA